MKRITVISVNTYLLGGNPHPRYAISTTTRHKNGFVTGRMGPEIEGEGNLEAELAKAYAQTLGGDVVALTYSREEADITMAALVSAFPA